MFHIRKKQYRHKRQAIMRANVQKKRKNAKTEVEKTTWHGYCYTKGRATVFFIPPFSVI